MEKHDAAENSTETSLLEENAVLRKKLRAFEKLEHDLVAEEIVEKAKKRFKQWLTIGGLTVLVAGAVGLRSVVNFVEELAQKRMEKVTDEIIEQKVQAHAKARVDAMLAQQKDELLAMSRQEVVSIVARLPISALQPLHKPVAGTAVDAQRGAVDLSQYMSAVRDQGNEGSAVGFAVAAAFEGLWARVHAKPIVISSRYLSYAARAAQGLRGDSGAYLKDAIQILRTPGAIQESAWPYTAGEFDTKVPPSVESADRFKIKSAQLIKSLTEIKAALQGGTPVVSGITLFESALRRTDGFIPEPGAKDAISGVHAICIVGYDDTKQRLKFKNSWSKTWGEGGYGYLTYTYVDKNLTEAWVLEL